MIIILKACVEVTTLLLSCNEKSYYYLHYLTSTACNLELTFFNYSLSAKRYSAGSKRRMRNCVEERRERSKEEAGVLGEGQSEDNKLGHNG